MNSSDDDTNEERTYPNSPNDGNIFDTFDDKGDDTEVLLSILRYVFKP